MTEGFAAHIIKLSDRILKSSIALIENGVLIDIIPLNRETPFTKFFDGALVLVKEGETPDHMGEIADKGDRVSLWQIYPYNLIENRTVENSRYFKLV